MLAGLLSESYDAGLKEAWENERTATFTRALLLCSPSEPKVLRTPVRAFAVQFHATGFWLRETTTIIAKLGVERSHEVFWN